MYEDGSQPKIMFSPARGRKCDVLVLVLGDMLPINVVEGEEIMWRYTSLEAHIPDT